jgi:biofilm PGA synthesis N-glycosyltransferase PgaC
MSSLTQVLSAIDHNVVYRALLVFYGAYPIFMALLWILQSLVFRCRQETTAATDLGQFPLVSVIIPAYCEEETIGRTLNALLVLDYPSYEVIVVNDGSPDRTADIVARYVGRSPVRLLDKQVNEGKAMALNDALPLCRGEILMIMDADIVATPGILRALVPHFLTPRVAAVTGNPRVENREKLLQRLQAIEFSAIISMQRRAQRVWGRVMTVSGAVFALRRSACVEVGLFSPGMATEDIDLTWRLQTKFWDVRYEPKAVVWMQVPPTLREHWKQRRRWALGLAQVLKRHGSVPLRWKLRRLWPVWYESWLSIAWAYTFLLITAYWVLSKLFGYSPYGASPIPNFWGMTIASACLLQLLVGALVDRQYDRRIMRCFGEAIYYPLIYWTLMATITSIYTLEALVRPQPQVQRWKIQRTRAAPAASMAAKAG